MEEGSSLPSPNDAQSVRAMAAWCADWPVTAVALAEGIAAEAPVVVLGGGRVVACSPAARAAGVARGMRQRDAQARCPELVVAREDPVRDVRAFEPVLSAIEQIGVGVTVLRPGLAALPARGPAGYWGGEAAAAERIVDAIAGACGLESQVGVADGLFTAVIAAREGAIVEPGGSAEFLADRPVQLLGWPELVSLLQRLGLHTLGAFAQLPASDVLARFGDAGRVAHRHARGLDTRPLGARTPPVDLDVVADFADEPLDRADRAVWATLPMAEQLHQRLAARGLAATRLRIEARLADGRVVARTWRHDGVLTAAQIAERTRWQLDAWLTMTALGDPDTAPPGAGPTASGQHRAVLGGSAGPGTPVGEGGAIVGLRLGPDGIVPWSGLQGALWGDTGEADARAQRAIARVQAALGPDAVQAAVRSGGRGPGERVTLVPWGDERVPARDPERPWPGQLPSPSPAVVYPEPLPAVLTGQDGALVGVTGRYELTTVPTHLAIGDQPAIEVAAWAGPWPDEQRWWDLDHAHRRARLQIQLAGGRAVLAMIEHGLWLVEGEYD
jgi:protein ImuB